MDILKMFSKDSAKVENYLGFFLKEKEGTVFFIEIDGKDYKILAKENFKYSNEWENIVEDLDEVIYKLETQIKKSPQKTIFFVYSHLINQKTKEIHSVYFEKIKKIVKNLGLKPLGYIECHEALSEFLERKEEVPLSALLIEFDKTNLSVFVYRAGHIVYSQNIDKTDNLIEDLIPVFERIRVQFVIPSRIILYDSYNLHAETSKLISYHWREDFFIQIPKVQVIHEEELTDALLETFVKQTASFKHTEDASKESEVMGFVIGKDIREEPLSKETVIKQKISLELPKVNFAGVLDGLLKLSHSIKLPKISFSKLQLVVIGGALILLAIFILEFFFHKAELVIVLPSKKISKDFSISDLKIKQETDSVTLADSKSATGTKEIGDKAKGTVTVYNITDSKSFSKGTVLIGPSGLKFGLNDDIRVASASGDPSSPNPGTMKAQITAVNIGSEYNLSAGTKLTIEGQASSEVIAKNDSTFSGGLKREIQTVARQDADDLKQRISDKTNDYIRRNLVAKLDKNFKIVESLTQIKSQKTELSKDVGEEADKLDIKSQIVLNYFIYNDKDLRNILTAALLKDKKEEGFIIKQDKINYTINEVRGVKDIRIFEVSASGKLVRNLNQKELLNDIKIKSTRSAIDLILKKYKVNSVEFFVKNPLPFLQNFIPPFKKNIDLKVIYQ